MFYSNYSQFLEPDLQINGFIARKSTNHFIEPPQYVKTQATTSPYDNGYLQFTETIGRRLVLRPYPTYFNNTNPFCPICLKLVNNNAFFSTCYIDNERNYLIHGQCLQKEKAYQGRSIEDIIESGFKVQEKSQITSQKFEYGLDSRQFYVEISISHPLSQKCFVKISKKVSLIRNYLLISFNERQLQSYSPNMVVVPLTDFHITVSVSEFGNKNSRSKFTKYLSLRHLNQSKSVNVCSDQIWFSAEIIQKNDQKQNVLNKMNYKYKYGDVNEMPLLRILDFHVKLPQQFQDSEEESFIIDNNSTIVQDLLKETEPSLSTIKSSQPSPQKRRVFSSDSNQSSKSPKLQVERVNLKQLINEKKLIQFVKNNTESRAFQSYLDQASANDIQIIIKQLKINSVELIMHEYGNYMIQKLFSVCNPLQRLEILQEVLPSLCDLIKNKQGTHTLQAFVTYFSTYEEYTFVIFQIRQEFYELCRNNNSTHFIRKVLKAFPIQYMIPYFAYTAENLLAFALDKNAMCIIKHMMRRLRQLQCKQQSNYQCLEQIRKQLITQVTFNVDKLIMDNYGNYVIQFCYELFDFQKCVGITQRILFKFATYAIGKFSSNVLLKCITTYWVDKRIYSSLKGLSNNQLVQIFRNKDGNKILLQFMERLQGTEFWDRLYGILIRIQPTRFYHDRWGVCLGSRSGQVGSRFNAFPEPKKKNFVRKF